MSVSAQQVNLLILGSGSTAFAATRAKDLGKPAVMIKGVDALRRCAS